jgi:hypothetical protein
MWTRATFLSFALCLTLTALPGDAAALGSRDLGPSVRLQALTVLYARLASNTEQLRVRAKGNGLSVTLLAPDGRQFTATPQPLGDGYFDPDDATQNGAPLVGTGRAGVWTIRFDGPNRGMLLLDFEIGVFDPATGIERAGRVYSTQWQFDAQSYDAVVNPAFYVAVPQTGGAAVWRVVAAGLAGYQFALQSNNLGVAAPNSSRSVPMQGNRLAPKFDVYLERPDLPLVEANTNALRSLDYAAGEFTFTLAADAVDATVRLTIDTDGDGQPLDGVDDTVVVAGVAGLNRVRWTAPPSVLGRGTVAVLTELAREEIHVTGVDIEYFNPGLRVFRETEGGPISVPMFWDDRAIDDGTLTLSLTPVGGLESGTPAEAAINGVNAHGWGGVLGFSGGVGDRTFIDTWVKGRTAQRTFGVVFGDGPTDPTGATGTTGGADTSDTPGTTGDPAETGTDTDTGGSGTAPGDDAGIDESTGTSDSAGPSGDGDSPLGADVIAPEIDAGDAEPNGSDSGPFDDGAAAAIDAGAGSTAGADSGSETAGPADTTGASDDAARNTGEAAEAGWIGFIGGGGCAVVTTEPAADRVAMHSILWAWAFAMASVRRRRR